MESQKMVTVPIAFSMPDGTEGVGWANISPDISAEGLEALRHLLAAAVAQSAPCKEGNPNQ